MDIVLITNIVLGGIFFLLVIGLVVFSIFCFAAIGTFNEIRKTFTILNHDYHKAKLSSVQLTRKILEVVMGLQSK